MLAFVTFFFSIKAFVTCDKAFQLHSCAVIVYWSLIANWMVEINYILLPSSVEVNKDHCMLNWKKPVYENGHALEYDMKCRVEWMVMFFSKESILPEKGTPYIAA